jgi:TrmH family RNA methyltransferase
LLEEVYILEGYDFNLDVNKFVVTESVMNKLSSTDTIPEIVGVVRKIDNNEIVGNKVLILDRIQDPGNLGTLIRSAVAFGVDTIILSNDTVDMYNSKVLRSAQGMIFNTNILRGNLIDYINELKNNNFEIIGTDVNEGISLKKMDKKDKYALVLGNEGNGLSNDVRDLCDSFIYIDMKDFVDSLNVGVAGSIILYEMSDING